jgi:hypothetical protein
VTQLKTAHEKESHVGGILQLLRRDGGLPELLGDSAPSQAELIPKHDINMKRRHHQLLTIPRASTMASTVDAEKRRRKGEGHFCWLK